MDFRRLWRWERQSKAPLIKDEWPHVAKLILEFEYQHALLFVPNPDAKTIELTPNEQAFFDYGCPLDCFQGEFELTNAVYSMIKSGEVERSGELVCHGERMGSGGPINCGLIMTYKVKVEYKTDT